VCNHRLRQIGPDCLDHRVFNWNNRYGFTHQFLNNYSNMFVASATPFVAYVTATRRTYEESVSPVDLCSLKTFTRAWFAFTDVQALDSGMACPLCGPTPDIVIPDGVSISYSSSKFAAGLRPPTVVDDTSPVNSSASLGTAGSRSAMFNAALRKEIQVITAGKVPPLGSGLSSAVRMLIPEVTALADLYCTMNSLMLAQSPRLISAVQTTLRELLKQVSSYSNRLI
jgi:hypothetical protein